VAHTRLATHRAYLQSRMLKRALQPELWRGIRGKNVENSESAGQALVRF
jgi:hypothetical protein